MELKIDIHIPEGYQIDKEKSTFERIVFKKIEDKKPEWKDLGPISGFFIDSNSYINYMHKVNCKIVNRNIWPTKELAEAALALSQLTQWRDKYNEEWVPNFNDTITLKFSLYVIGNIICKNDVYIVNSILAFKTDKIRNKFLDDFSELLEIAKPLL